MSGFQLGHTNAEITLYAGRKFALGPFSLQSAGFR